MSPAGVGIWLCSVAAGAVLGSLVATWVIRRLRDEPIAEGRSHCDGCRRRLSFADTVPIVSFLVRRGACRNCNARIDRLHPLAESVGAIIFASLWSVPAMDPKAWCVRALCAALGLTLLAIGLYDLRTLRIPDVLTLAVLALGLAITAVSRAGTIWTGLVAAAVSFVLLEGLRRGFHTLRGQAGLGLGDVKLFSALAVWLGAATPWAMVLACVLGLAFAARLRSSKARFAFGPAIAGGAWIVGLGGMSGWIG